MSISLFHLPHIYLPFPPPRPHNFSIVYFSFTPSYPYPDLIPFFPSPPSRENYICEMTHAILCFLQTDKISLAFAVKLKQMSPSLRPPSTMSRILPFSPYIFLFLDDHWVFNIPFNAHFVMFYFLTYIKIAKAFWIFNRIYDFFNGC